MKYYCIKQHTVLQNYAVSRRS